MKEKEKEPFIIERMWTGIMSSERVNKLEIEVPSKPD